MVDVPLDDEATLTTEQTIEDWEAQNGSDGDIQVGQSHNHFEMRTQK